MVLQIEWYGILIFFLTGLLFSISGLGGGSVYTPLFSVMGFDLKTFAVPGGNFLVFITALSSSINYVKHRLVCYKTSFSILLGSLPTAFFIQRFFYTKAEDKTIWFILGIGVLLSGLKILFVPDHLGQIKLKKTWQFFLLGFLLGILVGFISLTTSIGGGFLMVPILCQFSYETKVAIGTSAFTILFTSLVSFLLHFFYHFDHKYFITILIYSISVFSGAFLGSHLTSLKLNTQQTKKIMGTILSLIGIYILVQKL